MLDEAGNLENGKILNDNSSQSLNEETVENTIRYSSCDRLLPNTEMGFLYKKCTCIRPYVISQLALVPEFMDALKSFNGSFNDEVVYNILKDVSQKMIQDGTMYRTARGIMNKISKDVKNNSFAWKEV